MTSILHPNYKQTTPKQCANYKQSTSKLGASYIRLQANNIQTTGKLNPNYEQTTRKLYPNYRFIQSKRSGFATHLNATVEDCEMYNYVLSCPYLQSVLSVSGPPYKKYQLVFLTIGSGLQSCLIMCVKCIAELTLNKERKRTLFLPLNNIIILQ